MVEVVTSKQKKSRACVSFNYELRYGTMYLDSFILDLFVWQRALDLISCLLSSSRVGCDVVHWYQYGIAAIGE